MADIKLTVAIPTYNRSAILKKVAEALLGQSSGADSFFLLVVDNASTDDTCQQAKLLSGKFPHFEYVFEDRPGSSNARNAALRYCKTPWIAFLDDDAMPAGDYVEKLLAAIKRDDCDVIAGSIKPWKLYPLPIWFLDAYESFPADPHRSEGLLKENEYAYGGNVALRMEMVGKVGGFNTDFGVRGEIVPFGEDTELQIRIRKAGGRLRLVPSVAVAHCAVPDKYTILRQWEIRYLAGKSTQIFCELRGWRHLAIVCLKLPYRLLRAMYRSAMERLQGKYHWQNVAVDVVGEACFVAGLFCGWLWLRRHKEWYI